MKKVFIYSKISIFVFVATFLIFATYLLSSCTSLSQDKFIDENYPSEFLESENSDVVSGKIFYENNQNHTEYKIDINDLTIRIKKGIKYPVSNPLLALSDVKAENGSLNVFFRPFSGDDGNLKKQKYKAFLTIDGVEKKINQSVIIYKDNRGKQYIKKTFKIGEVSYKFQNSFSDFYVEYPYMFCEITNGDKIYKVFAVDEDYQSNLSSKSGEKRFISQGIKNENQKYIVVLGNSIIAEFTKSEYKIYQTTDGNVPNLKKSVAIILSMFRFIEEDEK